MADSDTVKELKEKYKDRIDPTKKEVEEGVIALTPLQKQAIEQGIDPESGMHWTAGDTLRNNVRQTDEAQKVEDEGNKAANLSISEDRKGVTSVNEPNKKGK